LAIKKDKEKKRKQKTKLKPMTQKAQLLAQRSVTSVSEKRNKSQRKGPP